MKRHVILVDDSDEEPQYQLPHYIQNRQVWTEAEVEQLIKWYEEGVRLWKIAKNLNRTYYSVKEKVRGMNLHRERS